MPDLNRSSLEILPSFPVKLRRVPSVDSTRSENVAIRTECPLSNPNSMFRETLVLPLHDSLFRSCLLLTKGSLRTNASADESSLWKVIPRLSLGPGFRMRRLLNLDGLLVMSAVDRTNHRVFWGVPCWSTNTDRLIQSCMGRLLFGGFLSVSVPSLSESLSESMQSRRRPK